jgi:hypothetical protein
MQTFRKSSTGTTIAAFCLASLAFLNPGGLAKADDTTGLDLTLIENQVIWDHASSNAFTDLISFQNQYFCAFREGTSHASEEGSIRIMASPDCRTWTSVAQINSTNNLDLRDPKFSITPAGQLMLTSAERNTTPRNYQSMVWFSNDGTQWGGGQNIGDPNKWLWRTTWHDGVCYSVGYDTNHTQSPTLYASTNGLEWTPTVPALVPPTNNPGETSLVFGDDGTAYALLRRDAGDYSALLGTATAAGNYTDWTWQNLGVRIGGPDMLMLPDGRLIAGVRLLDGVTRTSLCLVDPANGTLTEALTLPSGGDTGYPGMVLDGDRLWVSYYSTPSDGKSRIYLAEVKINSIPEPAMATMLASGCIVLLALLRLSYRGRHRAGYEITRDSRAV